MDPVTAIGLASAVISFVEISARIAKRLEELSKAGDAPIVFRHIKTRIPLIASIVTRIQDSREALAPDAKKAFDSVVQNCFQQIQQLETIIDKVTVRRGDSSFRRGLTAVSSLFQESRIQKISDDLGDNIQLLTTFKTTATEKRRPSIFGFNTDTPPPKYSESQVIFQVPFVRDARFIGREGALGEIDSLFQKSNRVAVAGVGGVGYGPSLLARISLTPPGNLKSLLNMPTATVILTLMHMCFGSLAVLLRGLTRVLKELLNV